jgi:hypothetical protein
MVEWTGGADMRLNGHYWARSGVVLQQLSGLFAFRHAPRETTDPAMSFKSDSGAFPMTHGQA